MNSLLVGRGNLLYEFGEILGLNIRPISLIVGGLVQQIAQVLLRSSDMSLIQQTL